MKNLAEGRLFTLSHYSPAMAHYLKFVVALAFSALGLMCFVLWPGWVGGGAFIGLFVIGSAVSAALFKRYATLEQVKEDLEARLYDN